MCVMCVLVCWYVEVNVPSVQQRVRARMVYDALNKAYAKYKKRLSKD